MKTLKQFYRELQAWIDAGCPEHREFHKLNGLCDNLAGWSNYWDDELYCEMEGSFGRAGLSPALPFNDGFYDYSAEGNKYKNPARLAWIKEHAK